jgi:hypothetical protein
MMDYVVEVIYTANLAVDFILKIRRMCLFINLPYGH